MQKKIRRVLLLACVLFMNTYSLIGKGTQDAVLGAAGVRGKAGPLRPAGCRSKRCWAVLLLTSFPVKKETKL